ncbi:MAG: response regulator [Polyangiaceae bacterium]
MNSRQRIVVAEDDRDARELVAERLRSEGYEVQEVSDGSQLLARVEDSIVLRGVSGRVDLLLTDVNMPGYTGLEIVTGLREAGMRMPVIIMTGMIDEETRAKARALGASFLSKPFDGAQLSALVARVLESAAASSG